MAEPIVGAVIRKRYVQAGADQVHLRESGAQSGTVPLVCLHATAYSSRSFDALMQALGAGRHVLALDLPGYGESDPLPGAPDMAAYAESVAAAITTATQGREVALFGYHTGVAVATEIALQQRIAIREMTFLGVPYFEALDFAAWKQRLATPHHMGVTLDQFAERWDYLVTQRPDGLSQRRGFENFVDELKAWPHGSRAHEALFAYPLGERLARLACPVTVLNPQGHLAEPSRAAAALIPGATVIELPELSGAVLDTAPEAIAALIPGWPVPSGPIPNEAESGRLRNTADRPTASPAIRGG